MISVSLRSCRSSLLFDPPKQEPVSVRGTCVTDSRNCRSRRAAAAGAAVYSRRRYRHLRSQITNTALHCTEHAVLLSTSSLHYRWRMLTE